MDKTKPSTVGRGKSLDAKYQKLKIFLITLIKLTGL